MKIKSIIALLLFVSIANAQDIPVEFNRNCDDLPEEIEEDVKYHKAFDHFAKLHNIPVSTPKQPIVKRTKKHDELIARFMTAWQREYSCNLDY